MASILIEKYLQEEYLLLLVVGHGKQNEMMLGNYRSKSNHLLHHMHHKNHGCVLSLEYINRNNLRMSSNPSKLFRKIQKLQISLILGFKTNRVSCNKDEAQHDFSFQAKNPLFQEVQTRPSFRPLKTMARGMPHRPTSCYNVMHLRMFILACLVLFVKDA